MRSDGYLAIALNRHLRQSLPFAIPSRHCVKFVETYVLMIRVSREDIVDSQSSVYKILVKCLACTA